MSMATRRQILIGSTAATLLPGCRAGELNRPLLATDHHPEGYPTVSAVRYMGELLARRTDGRLNIKMFAGGQLGSERDTLEITTFGGLDINRVAIAPLNAIEPMTIVPSLPFLFRTTAHMRMALDGRAGDEILASLKPHGLVGLCFYDSGERCFYNTKKPILTPDDMNGMKIRVQNSDLYVSMIRALGADATPMPLGEVFTSLVQGVIDGAENNWPSYQSGSHFEAAPFYSLTRHVMAPEVLVMSESRWAKLSPADRDIVMQTAKESVPFMRDLWDKRVDAARAALLAKGVKVNEVSDLSAFSDKMRPVWDRYVVTDRQKALVKFIENLEI